MAVSGKTTDFEIPYLDQEDIPDMGAGDKAIAERVDTILGGIEGDATLDTDLALTIADGAISSRKLAPTMGLLRTTKTQELTETYADATGVSTSISPLVDSLLTVTLVPYFQNVLAGLALATINVDGTRDPRNAIFSKEGFKDNPLGATVSQMYLIELSAGTHTIKMQAKKEGGTGELWPGSVMHWVLTADDR